VPEQSSRINELNPGGGSHTLSVRIHYTNGATTASPPVSIHVLVENCFMAALKFLFDLFYGEVSAARGNGGRILRNIAAQVLALELDLFRDFRDDVLLSTPAGRYYTDLYDRASPALIEALAQDPSLIQPTHAALVEWTPVIQALIDGNGGTVQITDAMRTNALAVLNRVRAVADPELLAILDAEADALDPDTWAGLTAAQLLALAESQTRPPPAITAQPAMQAVAAGGAATLSVEAEGAGPYSYQWFKDGAAIAGATGASYTLPSTQAFHAGDYSVAVANPFGETASDTAPLTVDTAPASDARLLNLSTRGLTLIDNDIMVPGFVIVGDGVKKLLVRVVGPRLDDFGVGGTLADPQLVLRRILAGGGTEIVDTNDDWETQTTGGTATEVEDIAARVGAFDLGADTKSAAIVVDVSAGQYGVIGSGVGGLTGVVIAEVYDADETDVEVGTAKLVNLSNRGFVSIGDKVMIPGFVVSNEGPKTFLIRGVGPSLASVGFNENLLADPQLNVFRKVDGADEFLFSNDDWENNPDSANTAAVAATVGAFPLDAGGKDAALVVTLPPGVYSAVVSGVAVTEGNALVEVYVVE
jgi:hypothetical protein